LAKTWLWIEEFRAPHFLLTVLELVVMIDNNDIT